MNTASLKKYAKAGLNVLLSGPHGVGKTAIIKEVFSDVFGEYYTHWRYFSASTLDPWVDFIGIPKNYTREDGKEVFGIVPPEHFTGDEEVRAIFFDEINRAEEKTLNALMELIQFKSINGRKFPNLQCIWAAQNPADDEDNAYSVSELDPAQDDRFEIQIDIPNKLDKKYFIEKYGKDYFDIAAQWWEKYKNKVSPRRLDKMLEGHQKGFNLNDYIRDTKVNVGVLIKSLDALHEIKTVRSVMDAGETAIREYFTLERVVALTPVLKRFPDIALTMSNTVDHEIVQVMLPELDKKTGDKIRAQLRSKVAKSLAADLNVSQQKFVEYNQKLNAISVESFLFKEFGSYLNRFYSAFKSADIGVLSRYGKAILPNDKGIDAINTWHWRQVLQKSPDKVAFQYFFKVLASCVMAHSGAHDCGYNLFRKMLGSGDCVNYLDIDKSVAKKVYQYADGKVKTKPDLDQLFVMEEAVA
jgi:DNA polymerase III delta prime subunit